MKLFPVKITNITDDEILYLQYQQPVDEWNSQDVSTSLAPKDSTTAWCNRVDQIVISTDPPRST